MIDDSAISKLVEDFEYQELESSDGKLTASCYSQLLALYIYQNDVNNAKYLWKRIPQPIKDANEELNAIWAVGKLICKRQYQSVYQQLHAFTWSENISKILTATEEKLRSRMLHLLSSAYSKVNLETVTQMTGLDYQTCREKCADLQWSEDIDEVTGLITLTPVPVNTVPAYNVSREEQFEKITKCISFFENE